MRLNFFILYLLNYFLIKQKKSIITTFITIMILEKMINRFNLITYLIS
jgi:hypothetical protein